jgi:predicted  nucleic acid-binding Zn-ribbon protein
MNTKQTVYNILASMKSEPVNVELGIFDKQTQADLDKAFAAADIAIDQVDKAKANLKKSVIAHKSQLSAYDKWISGLQKKADSITPTGNNKIDADNKKAAERTVADAKKQKDKIEGQMKEVEKLISKLAGFPF